MNNNNNNNNTNTTSELPPSKKLKIITSPIEEEKAFDSDEPHSPQVVEAEPSTPIYFPSDEKGYDYEGCCKVINEATLEGIQTYRKLQYYRESFSQLQKFNKTPTPAKIDKIIDEITQKYGTTNSDGIYSPSEPIDGSKLQLILREAFDLFECKKEMKEVFDKSELVSNLQNEIYDRMLRIESELPVNISETWTKEQKDDLEILLRRLDKWTGYLQCDETFIIIKGWAQEERIIPLSKKRIFKP